MWETVIGLEIHTQLATKSKIFSGASTAYGAEPNTQACEVDLGLPGVLPVLNKEAVAMAVKLGLAIDAQIAHRCVFARKNYFYPDLPKGYQISQLALPIVEHGKLDITLEDGTTKTIGITRAHLEEDAGKSLHEDFHGSTGIDLNRAGTPLIEIVSEPDMRSAEEAIAYMKKLHALVQFIGICDGNMQEGSFRCDANVSVRKKGDPLGTRTELKNINSFRFVERAINYEVQRQIDILEKGGEVKQQTRLYDPDNNETRKMRSKEEANDYRYFPDPDLLPVVIDDAYIESIRASMPELPEQKRQRFISEFELSDYDADVLTANPDLAAYFDATVADCKAPKLASNWIQGELTAALNKAGLEIKDSPVSAQQLAQLINRIQDNSITGKIGKQVFESMWAGKGDPDTIIEKEGLKPITDTAEIEKIIDEIISNSPQQVEQYKAGKEKLFGYFVGQAMKATKGKANPQQLNEILKKKLS